jgi:hypothetical protein
MFFSGAAELYYESAADIADDLEEAAESMVT